MPSIARIACIVEGHGEVETLPILVRRIGQALDPTLYIDVSAPIRIPRSKLLKQGELERASNLAALRTGGSGGTVVLIDADDDCPAALAPVLLQRMASGHPIQPSCAILAKAEFESWYLAAAISLRGQRGLPLDLYPPNEPEDIRNAKGWLSNQMTGTRAYSETLDQPALAATFDMDAAAAAPSFDKFRRDVRRLLMSVRVDH